MKLGTILWEISQTVHGTLTDYLRTFGSNLVCNDRTGLGSNETHGSHLLHSRSVGTRGSGCPLRAPPPTNTAADRFQSQETHAGSRSRLCVLPQVCTHRGTRRPSECGDMCDVPPGPPRHFRGSRSGYEAHRRWRFTAVQEAVQVALSRFLHTSPSRRDCEAGLHGLPWQHRRDRAASGQASCQDQDEGLPELPSGRGSVGGLRLLPSITARIMRE